MNVSSTHRGLVRLLLFLLLTGAGVLMIRQPAFRDSLNPDLIRDLSTSLGWRGPLVIIAYGLLSPLLLIPRWPLAFACGLLYGVFAGGLMATGVSLGGAVLQFLFAKSLFASSADRWKRKTPLLQKLPTEGVTSFWCLLALRAFPLSSFVATNLVAGSLNIPIRIFIPASFLGMIPSSLMYSAWGKLMKKPELEFYLLAVGLVVFITLGAHIMKKRFLPTLTSTSSTKDGPSLAQ